MLHRGSLQIGADFFVISDAVFAAVAIDTDLDQLMRLEAVVDFLEDRVGQAIFRNRNDRIQGVGLGARRWAEVSCCIVIKPFKNGILPNEENQNQQGVDDGTCQ